MTPTFTGFWETRGPEPAEVATTIGPITITELLGRLRGRLESVPAGTWVRIDLIAWEDE